MANTSVQANNKAVTFRGKARRDMPSVSRAQNRFMHAVAEGKVADVPSSVGKKFVKADHGRKIRKLPKHVRGRGMISEKARKKHLGGD